MTGAANFAKYEAKIFRPLTWKITDGMRLLLSGQTVQRFASHRSAVMKPPSWRPARHLTVLPQPASKLYPSDHRSDRVRLHRTLPELPLCLNLCKPIEPQGRRQPVPTSSCP